MRIYLSAIRADLEALVAGDSIVSGRVIPVSDDEQDEFEAFSEAAAHADVVISADVAVADAPVTLAEVASFHVDLDGSGDLAWFATQEIDAVLVALTNTASED